MGLENGDGTHNIPERGSAEHVRALAKKFVIESQSYDPEQDGLQIGADRYYGHLLWAISEQMLHVLFKDSEGGTEKVRNTSAHEQIITAVRDAMTARMNTDMSHIEPMDATDPKRHPEMYQHDDENKK